MTTSSTRACCRYLRSAANRDWCCTAAWRSATTLVARRPPREVRGFTGRRCPDCAKPQPSKPAARRRSLTQQLRSVLSSQATALAATVELQRADRQVVSGVGGRERGGRGRGPDVNGKVAVDYVAPTSPSLCHSFKRYSRP